MQASFSTLKPLPGGSHHYLSTTETMLQWLSSQQNREAAMFEPWVMKHYDVSERIGKDALATLARLGMIQHYTTGKITITKMGQTFLVSEELHRAKLLLTHLLPSYVGLRIILTLFSQQTSSLSIIEVMDHLEEEFPTWNGEAQYRDRINWLVSLGCLRQLKGKRSFEMTAFGQQMHELLVTSEKRNTDEATTLPVLQKVIQQVEEISPQQMQDLHQESAAIRACEAFGLDIKHLGTLGHTEVLLHTPETGERCTVLVDAQQEQYHRMEVHTLQEVRATQKVSYVVLVFREELAPEQPVVDTLSLTHQQVM